jgi:endonuclease III
MTVDEKFGSRMRQLLRSNSESAMELARTIRCIAEEAWGPDTAHPDSGYPAPASASTGQCYVSAMLAAHYMRVELGLPARVALGSLWSDDGKELKIPFHGWVVVGAPFEDPLVFDITADQGRNLPQVIAGTASNLRASGYCYQYQEVRDVAMEGSVVGRWLLLMARARNGTELSKLREDAGLDLSLIEDSDVRVRLDAELARVDNEDGLRILSACRQLSDRYSFSSTRTYPRPDHPDPRKRRSLTFLLTGILVSIRTTLENEQRAMDNVLERCTSDDDLRNISVEELASLIEPAGMQQKKAQTIQSALKYAQREFGDEFEQLSQMAMEDRREAILAIPGVGPKAADCFLSIGMGMPTAVVDTNVFRAYHHLFGTSTALAPSFNRTRDVEFVRLQIDSSVPADAFLRQIVHTLFLLYGKDRLGYREKSGQCAASQACLSCASKQQSLAFS